MNYLTSFLFFLICSIGYAQELPPIKTFLPEEYQAQNQNWGISQSDTGVIYIANNAGLLQYDGAKWELHAVPDNSIVRSVRVLGDKIFTGSFMDFGFWEKNKHGSLNYTSLVEALRLSLVEGEEFWNITTADGWVLFQSLSRIYLIDLQKGTAKIIESKENITKMFTLGQRVYFQKKGKGLYKLEHGKSVLVTDHELIASNRIINLHELENKLLIVTENRGVFFFDDDKFSKWEVDLDFFKYNIYSTVQLKNGSIVLGTISNGIFQIAVSGKVIHKINRANGLSNNTVLALFEDDQANLWSALDNGVNCINLASNFEVFIDDKGAIGTVYTSALHNGNLYLGTNQGLFYKREKSTDVFQFIPDTEGQVWILKVVDDTFFCGHNKGTLIIENEQVVKTFTESPGTWDLKKIQEKDALIMQGNYEGLSILKKTTTGWEYANKIEGFDISSRFFELRQNKLYVNHELKGFYELQIDDDFTKVLANRKVAIKENGFGSSVLNFNSDLIYSSSTGVYKQQTDKTFVKDTLFSNLFSGYDELTTLVPIKDSENKLWCFADNTIAIITPGNISTSPQIETIPISKSIKNMVLGFENNTQIGDNTYLIGTSSGYVVLNKENRESNYNYHITINSVEAHKIDEPVVSLKIDEKSVLENKHNNIRFDYSFPSFNKIFSNQYQYQLLGQSEHWSDWSYLSNQLFENLPFGTYTFNVRGRVGNQNTFNTASYDFEIKRPFLLSNAAIAAYILFGILFFLAVHRGYKWYYKKQQEDALEETKKALERKELESTQELMRLNNEKLKLEIKNKNQELTSSTSNLIKKNEILNTIKKALQKAESDKEGIKNVKIIIDKNLNSEEDWKHFEKAFNNTDKDFLKRIKEIHPDLTPNDLRFCTYLRLNLSSKEIAPLLNISVRSVEIKRYRLRKKFDLEHSQGLIDYIWTI